MLSSDERRALGEALANVRRKAGLTQAELAGAAELTQAAVSRAEAGHQLSLGTIRALARALGVQTSYILRQAGQ